MAKNKDKWLLKMLKGATFDDFLIRPGWGTAQTRKGISLRTRFSQNVSLNIPLVSANMDTVTGARMAIAMARAGGIGIVHRYLSIEEQCRRVVEVKRAESYIIREPYHIFPNATVEDAVQLMNKHKVGGLMVVTPIDEKLVVEGIITERDVKFCTNTVMVSERMTAFEKLVFIDPDTDFENARKVMDKNRLEKLPIIDKDRVLVGLVTAKDIESFETHPLANKDDEGRLIVGAAVGATGDYIERASELIKAGSDVIVMDIANFQSDVGLSAAYNFRNLFPETEIVVGNVVLPSAVEKYQYIGITGIKVGLGPGSACTTRFNTNIGVPQAQAVYECASVSNVPINADGGIRRDGHAVMALLLGASSVMIGGMFAGTDESPGLVFRDSTGTKVKSFRGMASREAMYERLRAEEADDPYEISSKISPEGIEKKVEYKGSVFPLIADAVGHIASAVSYMGAKSLQEAKAIFMKNPEEHLIKLSESTKVESWHR